MKKLIFCLIGFLVLSAAPAIAQDQDQGGGDNCNRCNRAILTELRAISANTEAGNANTAAMRTQIDALTAAVAALTTQVQSLQARSAVVLTNPAGFNNFAQQPQAGANAACTRIGYSSGVVLITERKNSPIPPLGGPSGHYQAATTVVCRP